MISVVSDEAVHGILETPAGEPIAGLVLAHGAGSDCRSPLLASLSMHLATLGFAVLRIDLAYRRLRPTGPPVGKNAGLPDRDSLRQAADWMRMRGYSRVILGGHSYGGRQASMLAAEEPACLDGLLLLSYPLHPPRSREQVRTAHFPSLHTPALFVHGTRDPFGSPDEMRDALTLLAGPVRLELIEGAGHDLGGDATLTRTVGALTPFLLERMLN